MGFVSIENIESAVLTCHYTCLITTPLSFELHFVRLFCKRSVDMSGYKKWSLISLATFYGCKFNFFVHDRAPFLTVYWIALLHHWMIHGRKNDGQWEIFQEFPVASYGFVDMLLILSWGFPGFFYKFSYCLSVCQCFKPDVVLGFTLFFCILRKIWIWWDRIRTRTIRNLRTITHFF